MDIYKTGETAYALPALFTRFFKSPKSNSNGKSSRSPFQNLRVRERNARDAHVALVYQPSRVLGWTLIIKQDVQRWKRDGGTGLKSSSNHYIYYTDGETHTESKRQLADYGAPTICEFGIVHNTNRPTLDRVK